MARIDYNETVFVIDSLSQLSVEQAYEYLKKVRDGILFPVSDVMGVPWTIERGDRIYFILHAIYGYEDDGHMTEAGEFDHLWYTTPDEPKEKETKVETVQTLVTLLQSHHDKTLHDRLLRELGDDIVKAIGTHIGMDYDEFVKSCKETGVEHYVQVEYMSSYIAEIVKRLGKHKSTANYIFDCKAIIQNICEKDSHSIRCQGEMGQYVYTVIANVTLPLCDAESNDGIHPTFGETKTYDSLSAYDTYAEAIANVEEVVSKWITNVFHNELPHIKRQ